MRDESAQNLDAINIQVTSQSNSAAISIQVTYPIKFRRY
jgi:hypothetical protein